jgi:pimeloyl-ACP methyl ester carboxylesterase
LHLLCVGRGRPAVVFEAGLAGCHAHWTLVQQGVSRFTTACSYDRAGSGWSDAGPPPRTADRIAGELHALLANAGIDPPRLMVAHSFGALSARLYAAMFSSEVAGLLLVDPLELSEWMPTSLEQRKTLDKGVRLCGRGALAARFGVATLVSRLASAGAFGLARLAVTMMSRGGFTRKDEGVLAPFIKSPPEARRALDVIWTQPKCFEAMAGEIQSLPESVLQVSASTPRDVPITVVSATNTSASRLKERERLASRSAGGRHVVAPASGHWIQLDQPELLVSAIRDMIESGPRMDDRMVRARGAHASGAGTPAEQ